MNDPSASGAPDQPSIPPRADQRAAVAPPTQPGEIRLAARPTVWPNVIGTIGILWSAMTFVCGGLGALTGFIAMFAAGQAPPGFNALHILQMALSFVLAVLLFIAGIGLVRRRRWGIVVSKVWAVGTIVVVCIGMAAMVLSFDEQAAATPMPPATSWFIGPAAGCGIAVGAAFPVFLLIWFGRSSIRREIEAWS